MSQDQGGEEREVVSDEEDEVDDGEGESDSDEVRTGFCFLSEDLE